MLNLFVKYIIISTIWQLSEHACCFFSVIHAYQAEQAEPAS